eukprot:NODE_9662_length_225_cov_1.159091_g9047_i0.p3 GENE.NODE_9662_length_225_cov_1.159091_g9047_i0~~NODE_9662_length_225_cov_1.159091_g9047_i0.p3  ORF type:complete len:51 (+),score=7.58 NODE_9662_length_225_cov_1.159091_g9047_i0:70-222(+)
MSGFTIAGRCIAVIIRLGADDKFNAIGTRSLNTHTIKIKAEAIKGAIHLH